MVASCSTGEVSQTFYKLQSIRLEYQRLVPRSPRQHEHQAFTAMLLPGAADVPVDTCKWTSVQMPKTFWGQEPQTFQGERFFVEPLQTVTTRPMIVRNRTQYDTGSFIDKATRQLRLIFVVGVTRLRTIAVVDVVFDFSVKVKANINTNFIKMLDERDTDGYATRNSGFCLSWVSNWHATGTGS